jgi:threonine aldolase
MSKRLAEDHSAAKNIAMLLNASDYISVDVDSVETNIVIFTLTESAPCTVMELLTELKEEHGVLMIPFRAGIRAVAHFDVSYDQCTQAAEAVLSVLDRMASEGKGAQTSVGAEAIGPYG